MPQVKESSLTVGAMSLQEFRRVEKYSSSHRLETCPGSSQQLLRRNLGKVENRKNLSESKDQRKTELYWPLLSWIELKLKKLVQSKNVHSIFNLAV